jgi:hypothetical protein
MVMRKSPSNDKYIIHEGINKNTNTSKESSGMHRSFIIKGKPDFEGLNLEEEYKWRNIHGFTSQQKKDLLANDPNYVHAEETRVYSGPQGIAVAYLNHETGTHQMDIQINNQRDNEDSMKAVQSMFEIELRCPLYYEGTKIEDPVFGLVKKLKLN